MKLVLAAVSLCSVWLAACPPAHAADPESPDLGAAFGRAVESIRRHQSADGAWPTPFTVTPTFQSPVSEVNVFTPAVIVDLLDPVAKEVGLTRELEQARASLRRQVEPTGLVRYHGNHGAVDPARRGCEIPPDADDTVLIWRIAPPADPALQTAARQEIERYKDDSGLYLTWLADNQVYRCFHERYAGREWNPPDVAVEMHIHLFLAGVDPGAAGRLCEALRRRMDDDRIWIWYTVAPLLPLLREADLAAKGCGIRVPQGRLDRAVPGQEPYMAQARLLQSLLLKDASRDGAPAIADPYVKALRAAARDGFAKIRNDPPLLYHNDPSATPPHYHWSEDFGLALWLRLYVETARRFPAALPPVPSTPASR